MTDEEKTTSGAGHVTDEEKAAAASAAAAELAKRKAESERERKAEDGPVSMADLHDVRTELRGELAKVRAERVPHAVPAAPSAPAQKRGGGVLGGFIGGVFVLLVLFGLATFGGRK